jgi:sugar phosphate isomerase/epimerase
MNLPVALQIYSIRDVAEKNMAGILPKVKEIGYDGVELAGMYGNSPAAVKSMVESAGLKPISAHVSYDEMMADPEGVIGAYAEIGCPWITIPYLQEEYRIGAARYDEAIAGIIKLGEVAKNFGMTLLYHNHEFEFMVHNGEYALDLMYKAVPADLLQTQVDTCWAKVAGLNPAEYLLKYKGRAPVVHFKDYCMEGDSVDGLLGMAALEGKTPKRNDTFRFKHLGAGSQDIPALVKASEEVGAKWLVVEQDFATEGMTTMECAKESLICLKSL